MNKLVVIRNGRIVRGVEAHVTKPNEMEARSSREAQKTKYRAELLQPNQVDYYKVHPDQAKNLGNETRRLLS